MYKQANRNAPQAVAAIRGTGTHASVHGEMRLYPRPNGVIVEVMLSGLPAGDRSCDHPIFGFHIHGGTTCSGNSTDPFADAGMHFNPHTCSHPYHAGDMPPLFSAGGKAYMKFLTDRFAVSDVLGKTVIVHDKPDDFTSQPSGNAGNKIACGVIRAVHVPFVRHDA